MQCRIGVMAPTSLATAKFRRFSLLAEEMGFDELWIPEDLGFRGGISQASVALEATTDLVVCLGVLPASARNVVFAAMEVSTLAQLFPRRVHVAVGHGMPAWMRAAGAWPADPVMLLTEYVQTLSALLRGEPPLPGACIDCSAVTLKETPKDIPRILMGVRRRRSLQVAGAIADGVVLSEPCTDQYVAVASALVKESGRDVSVVCYHLAMVSEDEEYIVETLRPSVSVFGQVDWRPHLVGLDFADEFSRLWQEHPDVADFRTHLRSEWILELALAGTAAAVQGRLTRLEAAGVESNVLIPCGNDPLESLRSMSSLLEKRRAATEQPASPGY